MVNFTLNLSFWNLLNSECRNWKNLLPLCKGCENIFFDNIK
jgi:hypothetical protein